MQIFKTSMIVLAIASTGLVGCATPEGGVGDKTKGGAVMGGIIGAIVGANAGGNKKENVVFGTAIGATLGAVIGQELDRQEEALKNSIGDSGATITNTGAELVVTLPEAITFDTGSSVVRPDLLGDLNKLAANLNEFDQTTVDILGHTDNVGEAGFNQQLSAQRADAVRIVLINDGVAAGRLRAFGRGENEPKATNLTEEGRQENRRVEIVIRPKV